ncbi:MAG: type I DNA topoisomerase [Candidatus Sungbacteria bacterium]|nr:type I DNA topoisomerase [Candidatus Sungbacteria bacterium]
MSKNLIIVESPTKARTISEFLGKDFRVDSSFGHVRDLPKSKLGVDIEHDFEPQYLIPLKSRPQVKRLKKEIHGALRVILATDEDREGEAIAWHLVQALDLNKNNQQLTINNRPQKKKKADSPKPEIGNRKKSLQVPSSEFQVPIIERIVFHEITKRAIEDALSHPRAIDMRLVNAQQARRILDRLVGYKLSPFLWKKMFRGLSAGRVQSPAVRLIVEREREIERFKPQEYWTMEALLQKNSELRTPNSELNAFEATLVKIGEKTLEKFDIANREQADGILKNLANARWRVASVEKRAAQKNPLPPYTTSTLQQDAFRRLGFSGRYTMRLAQQLYEGMDVGEGPAGLITYMRTDSVSIAAEAITRAQEFIKKTFGAAYAVHAGRRFKTKSKGAQEAHEAIRPTDPWRTPESLKQYLDPRQHKLYELIWQRFIATQMPAAVFNATTVDISATPNSQLQTPNFYLFRATGQVLTFDGFLRVYPLKFAETDLPELTPQEELNLKKLMPQQHFTEPPPRYNEASLVKTLEKYGVGRPSTYAPIISTIQDRGYVERFERRHLKPTQTGFLVNDLLVEHFPDIVDIQFTAKMEEELDEIAAGKEEWRPVIRQFYEPFASRLEQKYEEVKKIDQPVEATDETCEKCGKPMVVKMGRFGKFLACSGFPECKNAKPLREAPQSTGVACPKCGQGDIVVRKTRRGKVFFGCSRYPECDYASWEDPRKEKNEKKNGS